MASAALIPAAGDTPLARAAAWTDLPADERRRRAAEAANAHDAAVLWSLTEAWLLLRGKAGARVSRYTLRNYRAGITSLLSAWSAENVLRPGADAAALWIRRMEADGAATGTVALRLAAARSLYAALRWTRATEADPFRDTKPAKDTTPPWERRSPYPPEDVDALLAAAADPQDHVLVALGAHAGLRVSEALALRASDVDLHRRSLVVRAGKGGKRRTVALSATAAQALSVVMAGKAPTDDVLPYRSGEQARRRLEALCERAHVPYRGVHALRHSCGTRLVKQTKDLEMAARQLGHSSIETTRIYAKWSDDSLKTAVGSW